MRGDVSLKLLPLLGQRGVAELWFLLSSKFSESIHVHDECQHSSRNSKQKRTLGSIFLRKGVARAPGKAAALAENANPRVAIAETFPEAKPRSFAAEPP